MLLVTCALLLLTGTLFFKYLSYRSADINPKLGVTDGMLMPLPNTPNAVSTQTIIKSRRVTALPMKESVIRTKKKIFASLERMGHNTIVSENGNYIHAVFVSPLMGYRDDVEFFIDPKERLLQFRSASRVGKSDFGANKKRYNEFKLFYLN